jgi:hypothetical protein
MTTQTAFPFWVPNHQQPGDAIDMREGTLLRYGVWEDWPQIEALRRKEGDALGFVPKALYESILKRERHADRDRWRHSNILVTLDSGEITGFCFVSYRAAVARIFQIVVRSDARRWHRALIMVDAIERKARAVLKRGISCRVAIDLESNLFWTAVGFEVSSTVTSTWLNQRESKSKRPLHIYHKELREAAS